MKVKIDTTRLIHLLALVLLTIGGGQLLIKRWEWNRLSAYSFVCTIVCQISNVLMKISNGDIDLSNLLNGDESSLAKSKKNKEKKDGQNRPNKKKRK